MLACCHHCCKPLVINVTLAGLCAHIASQKSFQGSTCYCMFVSTLNLFTVDTAVLLWTSVKLPIHL